MVRTLLIPALGIFSLAIDTGNRQEVVDSDYSCFFQWNRLTVVVDHAYQGFSRLVKSKPGKTVAWWAGNRYRCDSTELGYIWMSPNGNRLFNAKNEPVHEAIKDGLCIYTCEGKRTGDIQPVRLTHWRQI
jgi:hypothetical protein